MFRKKGWVRRLELMDRRELEAEARRLNCARGFVFERVEKLACISNMLLPAVFPQDVLSRGDIPGRILATSTLPAHG